jgi:penicillin-binding protein-related factor A (putative recombinase)
MSVANRGKYAEGKVRDHFKALNDKILPFWFERLPDARAGSLQATLCDFLVVCRGTTFAIEAKETDQLSRLPKDKIKQVAKLRQADRCGMHSLVLVYFKKLEKWRVAPIAFFEGSPPSWDMQALPLFKTCAEALESVAVWDDVVHQGAHRIKRAA